MEKDIYPLIKYILVLLIVISFINFFLFTPVAVRGESMKPSLQDGDRLIVSKVSEINRFDEIVFDAPDQNKRYIKRVIGLPGDTVDMENDILYINGKSFKEPYLDKNKSPLPGFTLTGDFSLKELTGETKVPKDKLFVLGDNRLNSKDSRFFGFIPMKSVLGKAVYRIWPINEIGIPN